MCIPYAPRDRDVAIRLTYALLGAWIDNRDKLTDLCGNVHLSAARANLQSRENLVRDTRGVMILALHKFQVRLICNHSFKFEIILFDNNLNKLNIKIFYFKILNIDIKSIYYITES